MSNPSPAPAHRSSKTFQDLVAYSEAVRISSEPVLAPWAAQLDAAFQKFDGYVARLETSSVLPHANAELILAATFLNYTWGSYLLCGRGLMLPAALCARNALESMALKWLIDRNPGAATRFNTSDHFRPVAVRKELASRGADITLLERWYAQMSAVTHAGRTGLNWMSSPTGPTGWDLHFGGGVDPAVQEQFPAVLLYMLNSFEMGP